VYRLDVKWQQHGIVSIASSAVISRSKLIPDRHLSCSSGNILRSRRVSSRRSRLLAFPELQVVVTTAEQVTIDTVPLSSEAPVRFYLSLTFFLHELRMLLFSFEVLRIM